MFLIVGIGNIGNQYKNTRHNVGFMFADDIINILTKEHLVTQVQKFDSSLSKAKSFSNSLHVIKPNTYVNLSGNAVAQWCKFYKADVNNILVLYDDADLPLGKMKYKINNSHGGHNGLKSLDEMIGKGYHKVKIGISSKERRNNDLSNFVLSKFSDFEQMVINFQSKLFSILIKDLFLGERTKFVNFSKGMRVSNENINWSGLLSIINNINDATTVFINNYLIIKEDCPNKEVLLKINKDILTMYNSKIKKEYYPWFDLFTVCSKNDLV